MENVQKANIHKSQIQTLSLQGLDEILYHFSVNPKNFLAEFDLTPHDLGKEGIYISYSDYAQILQSASKECNAPHLGLLLSHTRTHSISSKGVFGILIKLCDSVGAALEAIIKYYNVISEGATYELKTDGPHAWFIRNGRFPRLKNNRILQDLSILDFNKVFIRTIGPQWKPEKILFTYPEPHQRKVYDDILACPIEFDAGIQAIQFPSAILDQELNPSSSILNQLMQDFVSLSHPTKKSFREVVSAAIDILLPSGVCGANSIARLFDLHPRSLRRRLLKDDLTFAKLLEERRRKHAQFFLKETNMTINEISIALGYGAPEAFTRAFQRWFKLLPSHWRQQHQQKNA